MFSQLLISSLIGCATSATIVETAQATGPLSRFVEVLTAPAYKEILDAANAATANDPITVFAPTNDAFTAAEAALGFNFVTTTDASQQATVLAVLKYHVEAGKKSSTDLVGAYNTASLSGEQAIVTLTGTPATAEIQGKTKVVISTLDVDCDNGYVHIVDNVILIPDTVAAITGATPSVSTLYTVLTLADYSDILAVVTGATPANPITVFAPTDAAFAAAGITTEYVTNPDNVAAVKEILKYHVVTSNVFAGALADTEATLATVEGSNIVVKKVGAKGTIGTVTVADTKTPSDPASVTLGDVLASNGVIHVIDQVLMMADPVPPPPSAAAGLVAPLATFIGCMLALLAF